MTKLEELKNKLDELTKSYLAWRREIDTEHNKRSGELYTLRVEIEKEKYKALVNGEGEFAYYYHPDFCESIYDTLKVTYLRRGDIEYIKLPSGDIKWHSQVDCSCEQDTFDPEFLFHSLDDLCIEVITRLDSVCTEYDDNTEAYYVDSEKRTRLFANVKEVIKKGSL